MYNDGGKITRHCRLGDSIMNTKHEIVNLYFLGAQKLDNSTWRVHLNLHKIKDKQCEWDNKEYSFDVNLDVKEGEKLEFSDDFGEYRYGIVEKTGIFNRGTESIKDFETFSSIQIQEIKKDEIVVCLSY